MLIGVPLEYAGVKFAEPWLGMVAYKGEWRRWYSDTQWVRMLCGFYFYWDDVSNGGHWQYFWNYAGKRHEDTEVHRQAPRTTQRSSRWRSAGRLAAATDTELSLSRSLFHPPAV